MRRMIVPWAWFCLMAVLPLFTSAANSQTSNSLSDADIQGAALARKILDQQPANNFTNSGVLEIRGENGRRSEFPVSCVTTVTATNWLIHYEADFHTNTSGWECLSVTHADAKPNRYLLVENHEHSVSSVVMAGTELAGNQTMIPFAHSDFWVCDLGLEFFHWPGQKILKKEFHRQCPCTVLESTNPNPSPDGYSRVVCWIDDDSLGIVEAYAYDANGRKLKNFYPKNLQKVNGQYQVESMVMENLQTGSRSVLEFDLNR